MTAASATASVEVPSARSAAGPYAHLSAAERFLHERRDAAWLALLGERGIELPAQRIIEIGCGEGSLLRTLAHHGADPARVSAVDIDVQRLRRAPRGAGRIAVSDGAALPFRNDVFDLAFAFTFFSSVFDSDVRRRAAAEALRVVRPGGLLLVYDFWLNPFNRRVRPLREGELRAVFAPNRVEVQRLTLAPPIVRALGGRRALCATLERWPFLRTHLLAAISKE